ncbi:heterokaryon incompatibility protein-domain-containing protein [Podospora conica]|nr:heterokaryon incompatibility protein-domain-containing protein [Schizothecium conicum]
MGILRRFLSDQAKNAKAIAATATAAPNLDLGGPSTNSPSYLSTLPPFQYTPLASPTTHFRILHLQPSPADLLTPWDSILLRGTLLASPIDAPPEYQALSYCWGDATPADSIVVDGAVLRITASCAAALRRMLKGMAGGRMIWVDSICINQAGDDAALAERGAQVAMMDRIYRGAAQVNVHLGEGDEGTEAACEAVKKLLLCSVKSLLPGPQKGYFVKKHRALAEEVLACTPEYPYGKLYGLFRRPWFERYWVIQEVVLARKVNFYCGKHLLLLGSIIAATDFSRLPLSDELSLTASHWRAYTLYYTSAQMWIRQREDPSANPGVPRPTLAQVILPPAILYEATRPEDKVHALYGICKRLGYDLPAPDYTKSLATVYTEAARAILAQDGPQALDALLQNACESRSGWSQNIPSWVPNLSSCLRKWSSTNLPNMYLNDRSNTWPAGRPTQPCKYELEPDSPKLRVKGRRMDVVREAGKPWEIDNTTNMFGSAPLPTGSHIFSLLEFLESWLAVTSRSMENPLSPTATTATTAALSRLAKVLAGDTRGSPSDADLEELARYLGLAMRLGKLDEDRPKTVLCDPLMEPQEYVQFGEKCFLSKAMHAQLGRIMPGMGWKTVFRTTRGYLGVGPHAAREGDIVVVFHGCSMAALVKRWGEGYRYVGPAYVAGMMHGEFWESGGKGDDEWFELM